MYYTSYILQCLPQTPFNPSILHLNHTNTYKHVVATTLMLYTTF